LRVSARELLRYEAEDATAPGALAFALPTNRGTLLAQCDADTPERACAALVAGARLGGARPLRVESMTPHRVTLQRP
jgi:hypothetical protein